MLFYVLLIEQVSDTKIRIYGKERLRVGDSGRMTYGEKMAITLTVKPEHLHYMGLMDKDVLSNVDYETVVKKNYFYADLPANLELIKCNKKNLKGAVRSFTEFSSPAEQFIITKRIRGPGIVEISEIYETNTELITKEEDIKFMEHAEYPPLIIGALFVADTLLKVNLYRMEDRKHVFLKVINFTDIRSESVDVLVHHNMHLKSISGVWVIDTFECAKQLMRGRSFCLNEILGRNLLENSASDGYQNGNCGKKYAEDTFCALIKLGVLDLCKELCEITGHQLDRTITFRAERTEYLLMHSMYQKKWLICRERKGNNHYTGGLVLEPRTGLFENIILIDFNSLYPSIIIEENLCFSTINRKARAGKENVDGACAGNTEEMALLPAILSTLITRRKKLKQELVKKYSSTYDARQKALKITANAIYGCLGSTGRFSNLEMAAFITGRGRELLMKAKSEIEKIGLTVLYGDTDSLMIKSDCSVEEIPSLAQKICASINNHYKFISIEMEDIFERIILYTKKKYAGITVKKEIILKGIERRDYCMLSNQFIYDVIWILLTSSDHNLVMKRLIELKTNLKTYGKENFVLERMLNKDPEKYTTPEGSPQVQLALRINEHITKNNLKMPLYKKNDIISYVMGHDGAFLPTESLEINYEYYLEQQFLTPFFRLVGVLKNFNVDAVRRLFNIQKRVVSSLRITTPCCNTPQSQTAFCNTCNAEIDKNFLRNQAIDNLRAEIELLYERKVMCPNCDNEQGLFLNCFNCGSNIPRKTRNKEFDDFLDDCRGTFPSFEIDEITKMSEYRTVNLFLYFREEIERSFTK
ncbi:DNA polymerase (pol2) [Vavraia culicis subsp. floridensis]|uniref:DNA polymerase n=1 Tax=Vavraia culicis (isolate floridensis) TaxID=948595 RepID=L2GT92_VAVCU|nr:DNA polymerase (pol2) [Vavraia culicis subsp. floridensis]ELA46508.1 DNA polymerase (pol2) [Vavraia culicis subsp. floridensis]